MAKSWLGCVNLARSRDYGCCQQERLGEQRQSAIPCSGPGRGSRGAWALWFGGNLALPLFVIIPIPSVLCRPKRPIYDSRSEFFGVSSLISHLKTFLTGLWETGQPELTCSHRATAEEAEQVAADLIAFERTYRQVLPAEMPSFCPVSGQWATLMLYRACQCIVCRDIDADSARAMLCAAPTPDVNTPAAHYSVDVLFRFLPDLVQRCGQTAEQDAVYDVLMAWCQQWPLSSVGVPDIQSVALEPIVMHRPLMTLYLNRVVAKRDARRAEHPEVQSLLREVAGEHAHLVPQWLLAPSS